jgi:antitoxin component YwqK of YwqJK toxin-antitoxin module
MKKEIIKKFSVLIFLIVFSSCTQSEYYESYYENGNLKEKHYWKKNKIGAPGYIADYNDDLDRVLVEEVYYPNGQLHFKRFKRDSVNGEEIGIARYYYESGTLKQLQNFRGNGGSFAPTVDETYYETGKTKEKYIKVLTIEGGLADVAIQKYDTLGKLAYNYKYPEFEETCKKVAFDYLKRTTKRILWLHDEGYVGGVCRGNPNQYCGRVSIENWTYDVVVYVGTNEYGECIVTGVWDNL